MAELGDMIGKLLEDPQSMQTISQLLGSLGEKPEKPELPDIDMGDFEKISGALRLLNGPPDERCSLLLALKPFVSARRGEKIEQSVKILKLLRIAEQTGGLGLV